jgi:hypothetical protein
VYYSAAIKVSLLSRFLPFPGMEEVERLYERFDVLRPPAVPAQSVAEVLETLLDMVRWDTAPTLGALATTLAVGVVGVGVAVTTAMCLVRPRALVSLLARIGLRGRRRRVIVGGSRLVTALGLGAAAGLAVFAPLSFHIYLKHEFPLVAGPVLMAKGFVLAWATYQVGRSRRQWLSRMGPIIVAGVLVTDHAMVQAEAWNTRPGVGVSWVGAVQARAASTFAVSWIPGAVAAFSGRWVVGVQPGAERRILDRARSGRSPFGGDEFFLVGRRDLATHQALYRYPDYWLYFPTDLIGSRGPGTACREDYLVRTLRRSFQYLSGRPPRTALRGLWPERVRPGGVISIVGHVETYGATVERVELVGTDGRVIPLGYDCRQGLFMGTYPAPEGTQSGLVTHRVWIVLADGHRWPGAFAYVTVDSEATEPRQAPVRVPVPQLTVDEIIEEDPGMPVADVGKGYVLFDLRLLRSRVDPAARRTGDGRPT